MSVLKLSKNDIIRNDDKEEKIKLKRSDLSYDSARVSGWEQANRQSLDILNDYNNRINKSEWLTKEDRAKYRSALDSYIETANLLRGINKTFGEGYSDEDEQKWNESLASMNSAYDSTEKYYSQWIDEKDYKGQRDGWFQKSNHFDDGYQFGDVTKTVVGSVTDLAENIGAGIMGMGEKALDALVALGPYFAQGQYYQNGGGYNLHADKMFDQSNKASKEWASDFVQKDLYDEQAVAKATIADPVKALINIDAETDSVFGEKTDSLIQSAGQLAGTAGLQAVGVPWWLTTGVTSLGGESENALNQGATLEQAAFSGLVSAGAEILTEKISGGIRFGGKTLDDVLAKQLAANISNKTVRTLAKLGLDMAGEGSEEVLSGVMSAIGQKMTYASDKEIGELFSSEEAFDSFIGGAVLGLGGGVIGNIREKSASNKQASEIYGNGADLVTEALDIDPNNTFAQKMQGKIDKGKSLSGGQINRLVEANENALVSQDKGKMKAAVESRLSELGESGDVSKLADVIVKAQSGEKLTSSERSILTNSKYGRRVSTELNPKSIESGEYTSKWAENIGTERINAEAYNRAVRDYSEQAENPSATKNTPVKENAVESEISTSEGSANQSVATAVMNDSDGNEVNVKVAKIADVENGEASLELEDGKTVKASDVDFGDSGIGLVYQSATEMVSGVGGFNVDAANLMVKGFNPSGTIEQASAYVSGFNKAYRYGAMGYPVSELARGVETSKLSAKLRENAYNLGKAYGEGKVAEKQAKIVSTVTKKGENISKAASKKGKVYFDGSAVGKSLTERQRASLKGLKVVAEAMGIDIHIFESALVNGKRVGENGSYDPVTKTIRIDLHAGADGNGVMLFTAAHELTHHIREVAPAKFKVFADALLEEYTKHGVSLDELIAKKIEHLERNNRINPNMTDEQIHDLAYEEVVADSCEAMLVDSTAIEALSRKIHERDKGLWETIKDFIAKLVARIKAAYEGLSPDSAEGNSVREMEISAERLQKLWVDALLDASEVSTEQTLGESGIIVNSKTDSASLMSVRDVLTDAERKKVSKALVERFGVTQAEAMNWLKAETSLASLILNPKYSQYLDYTADPNEEAIKSNSDYPQGTVDFSNICKKRRDFTEVMNRVLRNFPNHVFAATDLAKIRTIMEQEGMEVACAICYVEDRRQLDSVVAQDFVDSLTIYREGGKIRPDGKPFNANQLKAFKLIEGDTYTPSIYELISLEGRNSLKAKNPAMEEAWVKFNNARGMQSVRLLLNDAEYKRQILKYSPSVVERKNDHGGLRIYSFSDMEMFHLIDIIQVITDSATVGLSIQGYTKVNEYARAVKDTGEKLNRSLIPKGDLGYHMENGRVVLDFDTVEGIDINHPDFFDNIDNPNIGNIVIGINATQIKAAMTSKFIDQIIPFHTGQSNEVLGEKGIATWENYKDFQSERDASTKKKSSHQINIYTEVINAAEAEGKPIKNKVEFVNKFLEVCKENNLIPRFSDFLNVNENGDYVYTEGYHKFLVDFKTFDQNTGEYLPQMPVKPIFDNEYLTKLLTDYVKSQKVKDAELAKTMPKVLDRITKEIVKSDGAKYSDRDSSYLDAVNRGDMETAQRMVDEDAKAAGYTIKGSHGTLSYFTIFDRSFGNAEGDWGKGFYFTNNEEDVETNYASADGADLQLKIEKYAEQLGWTEEYGDLEYEDLIEVARKELTKGGPRVIKAYLRMDNPVVVGGPNETYFDFTEEYDEETDEYGEPTGKLVEFVEALTSVLEEYKANGAIDAEHAYVYDLLQDGDGYTASQLEKAAARTLENVMDENGDFASKEIIRAAFEEIGFDGIVDNTVAGKFGDRSGRRKAMAGVTLDTTHYIAFKSSQIKQSDPVVRDDNGNVIPLSERFNSKNSDIRYSDRDSQGNELSKEQQEFFKDSKVRDNKGNLMVLYHGTTANFNTFKKGDVGFHFGTKGAARGRVGFGKNVTLKEVYLNITNPLVFDEDLGSWDADFRLTRELYDMGILTQADAESVLFTDDRRYRRTTEAANKKLASVLLEKGYDGIAYSNTFETKKATTSYIVFNSNQAKEITNKTPTSNPDIRYSDRDSLGNELSAKQKEFFKDSKARDEEGNLLVLYHGTSTEQRITEFKTTEGWRTGLWLSTDHETAVHFARLTEYLENDPSDDTRLFTKENSSDGIGRQGVYELYANVKNPLIVDAQGKRYWEIPRPSAMGKGDAVSGEEINAFALENNYDGVIIENVVEGSNRLGTDVIIFSTNQAKYTDNLNPTESNDIRYSDREKTSYAPTFYSHMGKVIDEIKLEKMGTSSILNHLKNRGVKDEELKWSGIEAFLEGKKSVTKAELQEFVAGSQLQIVEQGNDDTFETHYKSDNELVLTRNGKDELRFEWDEDEEAWKAVGGDAWFNDEDEILDAAHKGYGSTKWSEYTLEGGTNYRELVFKIPNSTYSNRAMRVHWGEDAEGVLAHARIQDFVVDGKKMLFVEEIQSDWHNEGHQKGYVTKEYEDAVAVYDKLAEDYANKRRAFNQYVRSGDFRSDPDEVSKKKFDWLRRKMDDAEKRMQAAERDVDALKEKGMGDVPDTPFRNNYHEYVLKRLLRMAAEEGYDSIGWTPADIQSDRWSDEYAEGYRIEYDQDIPKFLRKYGKKWGANVGRTTLPYLESRTTFYDVNRREDFSGILEWQDAVERDLRAQGAPMRNLMYQPDGDYYIAYDKVSGIEYDRAEIHKTSGTVWSMDITDSMKDSVLYEGQVLYSDRVTDKKTLDFLENQEHVTVYRAMQVIDGELYPPMAAKVKSDDGKKKLVTPSKIGAWEQAVERPDLIRNGNKFELDKANGSSIQAAYNPYFHTSASPLNDQFSSAYKRPNLVVVEGVIPSSELTSGYRAEFAKDTVGETKWHSGPVAGKLKGDKARRVFLSRWFKPVRIVPDAEVASIVAKTLEGENIDIPYNVVTPSLRTELEKVGVPIKYQDRGSDSYSNRSLLAGALETAVQNDIEREKLRQYKGKIDLINSEEQKLHDLREQIKELSFKKGPRDTEAIRSLQFEANQAANRINTYDKQLLNLESTKALKGVLEREKALARKRDAQKYKESLERYREKSAKAQRELMDRYQESRKRGIESRNKTAMRHKIKEVVNDLNNYLLKGTKDKHVPIELQKAVAEALDAVNMDTVGAEERIAGKRAEMMRAGTPEAVEKLAKEIETIQEMGGNMAKKIARLKTAYDSIINSDDPLVANSHDEVISNTIQRVGEVVGETPLRDMSLHQLEEVYDMYRMVLFTIRNANKAFKAKKSEEISVIANRVMEEVDKLGKKKALQSKAGQTLSEFDWNNQKPIYAFERIGSDTFTEVFNNVRAGEDAWATDMTEAQEFREEQYKKHKYDSWDFKKRFGFTSASGMHFELTLDQIMSLYAYSKRDQAAEHLKRGGIVFDETTEVTVKNKLGFSTKFNPTEATAYNISEETLADIISKLTAEQKAFVDEMQDYLSTTMGEKGNEVSLELYGVKLFKEKHYFPLKSATQFMAKAKEQQKGEVKIKNSGFTKETVRKANNPIVLTPFMDVWAGHVNEMSMYHAFTLALEDFYRVYNYKTPTSETMATESVEMFLQNAHGKGATKYIDQLLKDLNGGARVDSTVGIINKLTGLFKKSAVFASASVVVQQPSAIARATALVDAKYFVGKPSKHKETWAEVKKYAPVAVIKEMGYFDTGMGKSSVEWLKGEKTWKDKVDDIASKAPALADEYAWCVIWNAVKRETVHNNPKLKTSSDEFLKLVGERFTEVIVKTQVYDSVLARSANMRSKDTGMKMATAFMGEPTTSLNMLQDALIQGKRGNKKYAAKAIGGVVSSMILNSILVSIVYAGRDDDEEKTYAEKYISTLTEELLDSFNPLTLIPFIKDIVSIAQGYDIERSDMAVITDLINAWNNLDSDNRSVYRKVEDFGGAIASIFGLPVKNVMRDIRGMYNTIKSFISGEKTTGTGIASAIAESVTGKEKSNGQQLYEAMLKGDSAQVERLKGRFEDQKDIDAAIRKALRENDPRMKEAAETYLAGDYATSNALREEIVAEGVFEWKLVTDAFKAEVKYLKDKANED